METLIEIGKDADGNPIMVSAIQCKGVPDLDPVHIKVYIDPVKGGKHRKTKNPPEQTKMDL